MTTTPGISSSASEHKKLRHRGTKQRPGRGGRQTLPCKCQTSADLSAVCKESGAGTGRASPGAQRDPHGGAYRCSLPHCSTAGKQRGKRRLRKQMSEAGGCGEREYRRKGDAWSGRSRRTGCLSRQNTRTHTHKHTPLHPRAPWRPDTPAASPGTRASQPIPPRTEKPAPNPSAGGQEDGPPRPPPRLPPRGARRTRRGRAAAAVPWAAAAPSAPLGPGSPCGGGAAAAPSPPPARPRSPGAAGLRRAPRAAALPPRIRWRGGRKRAPVTWPRAPPAPVRGETGAGSTCGMRPDPTAAASPRRAGEGGRTSPLHGCACKPAPEHVGGIGSSRRPFPSAGAVQSAPPTAERAPCPERKERREGPDRKHRPASDTIANIKTRPGSYNFTPGLRHSPPETVASVQFWAKIRFDFISIRRALKNRDPLLGPTRLSPLDPHSIFKIEVCPILH